MVDANDPAWQAVAGARTVLLAAPRSFCAGVERAIEIVERALRQRGGPVYVRKQIVHNTHVVADLETRGAMFVDELDAVPDIRPEWLDGVGVIGLTAGASAPPGQVDAVLAALAGLGELSVTEREITRETTHFTLPPL